MQSGFKNASRVAVETLKSHGFEAFLIGGSVRDFIMGAPIGDIDVTTNATPEQVKAAFADFRVIETGIKHGTVTVLIDNEPVEITTYRCESVYSDNRHPDSVTFSTSLADDVVRRDFTMNGIAYGFDSGFCDLVGGIQDINNKTIRCIGNPEERFHEDALRIFRAMRFSAVLGFKIEENTKRAVHNCRELLKNISAERIRDELVKLICGKNAYGVLQEFSDVIGVFIPELSACVSFLQYNRHHIYDVYIHTIKALERSRPDPIIRMSLLLHDIGKPLTAHFDEKGERHFYGHPKKSAEMAEKILTRLRFDNDTKNKIVTLVAFHDSPIMLEQSVAPDRKRIKRIMSQIGEELIYDLVEIKKCDNLAQDPRFYRGDGFYNEIYRIIDEIISEKECFSVKDLKINGNDLIRLGFKGKQIGDALKMCLSAVIDGKIPNEYSALADFLNKKN
ncbi:MAG: HD domain-containing protein [Oscillospiraceae bacterium]|nr:HD domain-containing protein [Oscillospiraceae bacterium]